MAADQSWYDLQDVDGGTNSEIGGYVAYALFGGLRKRPAYGGGGGRKEY